MLRYGQTGARPKVYIQAALHANELPGALALHHLEAWLDEHLATNPMRGELVLLPLTNPMGLTQQVQDAHLGRSALTSGKNFNRHFPALGPQLIERAGPQSNITLIRNVMAELLTEYVTYREDEQLKLELLRLSIDADYIINLHCTSEALLHVYTNDSAWSQLQLLAAESG